jgi:hypothetical protein
MCTTTPHSFAKLDPEKVDTSVPKTEDADE